MSKVYIIRKYIVAEDIHDAMRQEPSTPIHECFLEEESVKDLTFRLNKATKPVEEQIGFTKEDHGDDECVCGHKRRDHGPSRSINYTEGRCLANMPKCDCKHFMMK